MSFRHRAWVCCAAFVLAIGCSDESESDGGKAGAAGATGGGAGGSGTGGSSGAAGTPTGGGSGAAGTPSAGASGAGAAGGGSGAGGGAAGEGGASGAGGGSATGSVLCEGTPCAVPANFCCAQYNTPDQCVVAGGTCMYGVEVTCDGPEDCPGQVCCGTLYIQGKNKSYLHFDCAASCTGTEEREICGSSGSCSLGGTCGPSDLLPNFQDCK